MISSVFFPYPSFAGHPRTDTSKGHVVKIDVSDTFEILLVGLVSQPPSQLKKLVLEPELELGDVSEHSRTASQQMGRMALWDLRLWDTARARYSRYPGDRG